MVHLHLRRRAQIAPPLAPDDHLDDDLLSAFTEGRLNLNESTPVLKHLVACSFCRHITAQLVRLDSEVGEPEVALPIDQDDPGRIRRLLDDLGSRVFVPTDDEAVFAYHAPAEDLKPNAEASDKQDDLAQDADTPFNAEPSDHSQDKS